MIAHVAPRSSESASDALFSVTGEGDGIDGTQVVGGVDGADGSLFVVGGKHEGEKTDLGAGTCFIGRSSKCGLVLRRSAGVSRRHAKITYLGSSYVIEDLGSRNGTKVNGKKIGEPTPLNDGDVVQISDARIRFEGPSSRKGAVVGEETARKKAAGDPSRLPPRGPAARDATQRVRARSPESMLDTREGELSDKHPHAPPGEPRHVVPVGDAEPGAPTAMFKGELPSKKASTRPPAPAPAPVADSTPYVSQPPPKRTGLFVLGSILGLLVVVAGFVAWDITANDAAYLATVIGQAQENLVEEEVVASEVVIETPPAGEASGDGDSTPPSEPAAAASTEPAETAAEDVASDEAPDGAPSEPAAVAEPSAEAAPAEAAAPEAAPAPAEPAAEQTQAVAVRSRVSGRVRTVKVAAGDRVRAGDVLLVLEPSGPVARKLRALRREEKSFAKYAAQGNARAQQDLDEVRAEIARVESRQQGAVVKASESGRVEKVLIGAGDRVRSGVVVALLAAE